MKKKYIVIQPDTPEPEFIKAKVKMNDSLYTISNQYYGKLAALHSDGNGLTFYCDDDAFRLNYADADYLLHLLLAERGFDRGTKVYELKSVKEK